MSTKTTFKRVALVAVAALGLGGISAVSAHAAQQTPTNITVAAPNGFRSGVLTSIPVTFALPAGTAAGDTITVAARVSSAPATSFSTAKGAVPGTAAISSTAATDETNGSTVGTFYWGNPSSGSGSYGTALKTANTLNSAGTATDGTNNWTAAATYTVNALDSKTSVTLSLKLKADAAGSYNILIYASNGTSSYTTAANLASATTASVVLNTVSTTTSVTTGAVPTTATLTAVTSGAALGSAYGNLYKVTLTDATGARASLGTGEVLALTSPSSTVTFQKSDGSAAITTLGSADFSSGVAYFEVLDSVAETAGVTVTGAGLLSNTVTATSTSTAVTPTGTAGTDTSTIGKVSTDKTLTTTGETSASAGLIYYAASTASTSNTLRLTGTAANVDGYNVLDTSGVITGKASARYSSTATIGATATPYVALTFTGALAASATYRVDLISTSSGSSSVITSAILTGRAAADTTMTITSASRTVAAGSASTFTAKLTDQFGKARASSGVTVTVSGRNVASATTYTAADGTVSYTVTDIGTVGTTDTVTFTSATVSGATASASIYYGNAVAGAVTVAGPQALLTGSALLAAYSDINSTNDGAELNAVAVKATVKDANGALMAGIPVTFTVAGTGVAVPSAEAVVYTGADGTATSHVYAWVAGSYVVTATAGGKSGTDTVYWAEKTTTSARTITATASGSSVIATVSDRFGNPVKGVDVYASRTGNGSFAGASSAHAVTGAAGTAEFVVTPGSADTVVTVALGNSSAADIQFGESSSPAGKYCAGAGCTATAYTATVAGTTTTSESGVGASIAPAGVNSATATVSANTDTLNAAQAAVDAANEATDAANAATDAANNAMDSADAAQQAALDAGDKADAALAAVTDLATKVSAIASQIATLSALVKKIAAKVKA